MLYKLKRPYENITYLYIKVFLKFSFKSIKRCQLPHLQSQAVPQHISATRKVSFIKFGVGFWNSELVFIQEHPGNDCFLWHICSEMQKLPRIFYSLRKAENFYMTVPFMYNFRSLSNKIPMRLSQDGFLVISFIFSIRFCLFSFVFAA